MNNSKRFLSVVLSILICFSCFSAFGCNKKTPDSESGAETPKKTTITANLAETEAEVGEMVELPDPVVKDKDGKDISATSEYFVTAVDPEGNDAFIDEAGTVKKLEILLIGEYKITYTLLDDETISCEVKITAKDTVAPVVKDMLDFKSDLFNGETFTLPRPVPDDASGVDVTKTKLTVTANKDGKEIALDDKKSFVANDLEGYTLHVSLTDNNGLEKTYDYPIRVTEKWLEGGHLKGREVATFSQPEYINNVKLCDIRNMNFELVDKVPDANADNNIGSSDGKALKVTLPEGAVKERRWLRVWLPQPLKRDFGSLKMKLWFNDSVESVWWHNRELENSNVIAAWSSGKNYPEADMVAERWNVVEAQEIKFNDEVYPTQVEYLDFAFWLKNNDVEPEIYIDEIFYDTIETTFVDKNVSDGDVIADFNEIGQSDYMGNPSKVGYEETIKVRGDVDRKVEYTLGTRRSIIDYVDRGSVEFGGNGQVTGDKALKVTPKIHSNGAILDSNFFFMFPKTIEYNENYFIEMDIYIPNVEYGFLVRSYSEDKPYFSIKTAVDGANDVPLKAKEWNTVRIPMKIFAGDLEVHGHGGMFIQVYDTLAADGKAEPAPCYIDNIVVSKYALNPKEVVLEDFTNNNTTGENPLVTFTKTDNSKGEYLSPEKAPQAVGANLVTKGTGAYMIQHTALAGDASRLTFKFKTPLKMDEFKEIRVYFYVNAPFTFSRITCKNANGDDSDNAGDATHPNGYIWAQGNAGFYVFSMPNGGKLAAQSGPFKEIASVSFDINCTGASSICVVDKLTYVSTDSTITLRK